MGEKGFTLIELLIVVAILGTLAAVIIPNVSTFMASSTLSAANTEAENVKTAVTAYCADHGTWDGVNDPVTGYPAYVVGELKAIYTIDVNTGFITDANPTGWRGIVWETGTDGQEKWVRQ